MSKTKEISHNPTLQLLHTTKNLNRTLTRRWSDNTDGVTSLNLGASDHIDVGDLQDAVGICGRGDEIRCSVGLRRREEHYKMRLRTLLPRSPPPPIRVCYILTRRVLDSSLQFSDSLQHHKSRWQASKRGQRRSFSNTRGLCAVGEDGCRRDRLWAFLWTVINASKTGSTLSQRWSTKFLGGITIFWVPLG